MSDKNSKSSPEKRKESTERIEKALKKVDNLGSQSIDRGVSRNKGSGSDKGDR